MFRFLSCFHDEKQENLRKPGRAFIPVPNASLSGLYEVNRDLVSQAARGSEETDTATLDMDATLVETTKHESLWCYKGFKSYQPLNVYWAEHDLYQRCGKSEEAHAVMKHDLAGGRLPSGCFGENAAWWGIMILAFNLHVLMKRLVLGGQWVTRRLKAIRFGIICIAGRVIKHSCQLWVRLSAENTNLFFHARERILSLAGFPGD